MSIKKISKLMVAMVLLVSFVFALCSCGSPEAKFEKAQKEEIYNFIDAFLDSYSNASLSDEMTVDSKVKVILGAPLLSSLKANTGIDFDFTKNIALDLKTVMNQNGLSAEADLAYGKNTLASIAAIMDMANGNAYALFPQISEKYLGIPLGMMPAVGMTNTLDTMPSPETLRKIIDRYIDIIFDNLPEITTEKGELTIDGVSESCTIYTIQFTKADILNLGKTILSTAKDDADIKSFIKDFYEMQTGGNAFEDYSAEDAYNDFKEYLTDIIEEIDEELKADDVNTVFATWTSYFKKNEIIGNKIEIPEADLEFFCGSAQAKSDIGFDCYLNIDDSEIFRLAGDLTENKNELSGELEVKYNEKSICFIQLEDIDQKTWEDGYLNGAISISPSKGTMDILRSILPSEYATFASTCALKFDVESSKNKSDITISLMSGKESYISLNVVSTTTDSATINIPNDSQVIIGADEWAETLDPNKLEEALDAIKNSGLPSDIIALIETIIPV